MRDSSDIKKTPPEDSLILGFDSEYVQNGRNNRLLSYQLFGLYHGCEWQLFLVQRGERLTLSEIIGRALEAGKSAGAFSHFPETIWLCAHFSIADLTMLKNYAELKNQFDSLRKTHVSLLAPVKAKWTDRNRHQREVSVILRDTMLLTPQGKSLASLGILHGLPKIELPFGAIENMELLLDADPELFRRYGMRDAEIAARHGLYMASLNRQWTGDCAIPVTLGGLAAGFSKSYWNGAGVDWLAALGFKRLKKSKFTPKGYRPIECDEPLAGFVENAGLATEAYHGGRNEAFIFGATKKGMFKDWDIVGAYSTVLAMVGTPRYDEVIHTTRLEDFGADTMGFARVRFKFPDAVRFPSLPVRTDFGLVFVREGETHCTAAEIFAASRLGAEVTILEGVVVPTTADCIFGNVIAEITRQRNANKNDPLLSGLYKEMANSLYGKTAQALREKKAFDSRIGRSVVMQKSEFTNPYIAATVTGFVRALLGEILNSLPATRCVVSVTTDGFLSDASDSEIAIASQGPLARIFSNSRLKICGDPTTLVVKHTISQVLCWRTRSATTLLLFGEGGVVLAKAGIKLPGKRKGVAEENEEIIELFLNRTPQTELEIEVFSSLREIWHEGGDLCKTSIARRVRMDYDWKRQPAQSSTVGVREQPYLAFATDPWQTAHDFINCRKHWETFYQESKRCLRNEQDLRAFIEYLQAAGLNDQGVNRSIQHGPIKPAMRMICRAFVRSMWGFEKKGNSYKEFALFLSYGGLPVTVADLKNAARIANDPVKNCIPRTAAVLALVGHLKTRFPNFQEAKLLRRQIEHAEDPEATNEVQPLHFG